MTLFRSILYVAIFYPLSFFYVAFASLLLPLGQPAVIFAARSWAWFHRFCITVLLGQRVRVIGKMPEGPFLYVFKHESMFETIDMLCLFRQPAIVAKAELTRIPLWGRLAVAHGIIPVERQAGARALRAMMKAATQALADGRPICLFPEGTRTTHGERPPLRSGFAGLYKMLKVPVIPVAVDSGRLSPRGKFMKRPGLITFHVGETIPPGLPREEAEARVHAAINAINRRPL